MNGPNISSTGLHTLRRVDWSGHAPAQGVGQTERVRPNRANLVDSAEYHATLLKSIPDLAARVSDLLEAEALERERRGKFYDLRPLIEDLQAKDAQNLELRLAARSGATGRPEEVLLALGIDPVTARVHRTALHLKNNK